MTANGTETSTFDPLERNREASHPGKVVGPSFEPIRHLGRLSIALGCRSCAALARCVQAILHARTDTQCTRPKWAEEPLVSRNREQIDSKDLHVDRLMPSSLRGINQNMRSVLVCNVRDLSDRLDGSADIGRMLCGDEDCLFSHRGSNVVRIDSAGRGVNLYSGNQRPVALQFLEGSKD